MSHLFAFKSYLVQHILLSNTQCHVLMSSLTLTDFYTERRLPIYAVTYIRIDGLFLLLGNKAKVHGFFLSKNEYFIAFAYMPAVISYLLNLLRC